jgi:hypothetical protein
VDEEAALKPIRELLEKVRERVDYAIGRLKSFEEVRALAWRCRGCGFTKKFTRPSAGGDGASLSEVPRNGV